MMFAGHAADPESQQYTPEYVSRKGYDLKDLVSSFFNNLDIRNSSGIGKIMHYTADMICSGGILIWQKLCWDYTFEHIGVANPRIFPYLLGQFRKLNIYHVKYPLDSFCRIKDVQRQSMEVVLIIQGCIRKPKIKMPSVPANSHDNENWLHSNVHLSAIQVPHMAVRRTWHSTYDKRQSLCGGNELVYACLEGVTERALFWMKWLTEEDNIHRKKYSTGITSMERGPANLTTKQRTSIGMYICYILEEIYKDIAERRLINMSDEFKCLADIYKGSDPCITARRKSGCLVTMIQILTEVPKWKNPISPPLTKNIQNITTISIQSEIFFKEILVLPLPQKALPSTIGSITARKQGKPIKKTEEQLDFADSLIFDFYNKK